MAKSPAWQRKEGQNPEGGLNAKGRASAKAEGHNLKPPAPHPKTDADAARRKSYCARAKGMKAKLTSSETANDPDSRINKSLRAWNCADGGPIWEKDRPKGLGKPEKLTPSEKRSAKASAKAAGRPYPNLVDNMRAARAGGGALKAALEIAQKINSAKTSVNQIPGLFKSKVLETLPNHRNLDIGGGKYDTGTEFLKSRGIESHVYDPFNRAAEHNEAVMGRFKENPADSVTVANVLNVIQEPEARAAVIKQAMDALRPGGKAYFSVYEGNKSGLGTETPKGWQENRRALEYLDEIKKHFPEAQRKGDIIYGSRPEMGAGGDVFKAAMKAAADVIRAYHGSPHKFDKFDISKIGTGEGAQAYGHGLYFAGNENVAKSYRDALAPGVTLAADNRRLIDMPEHERQVYNYLYRTGKTPQDAVAHFEKESAAENEMMKMLEMGDTGPSTYNKYIEFARNLKDKPTFANKGLGNMYEVGINAKPEHLLDWDKPLNAQSDFVRQSLRNIDVKPKSGFGIKDMVETVDAAKSDPKLSYLLSSRGSPVNPQGSSLYEMLANRKGATDWPITADAALRQKYRQKGASGASEILQEHGIPGIKYLDQGSRGTGEGSSNYVVFDPKIIDIMRRYARGGMTRHGYATDGSVEGDVSYLDTPDFEDSGSVMAKLAPSRPQKDPSDFIKQELAYGDKQLPQYDPEAGKKTGMQALEIAKAAGYLTPASPYLAVGDFAKQMLTGEPIGAAIASAFLPGGKYAKMAGAALASQAGPEEAEAGPYTKFLMELAEKYRPHYDPSAMIKGQPKDKWISDVGLSRPIQDMKVRTTEQRNMIPEANIEPVAMENKAMISGFGDRTPAGYVVTHLNDKELTRPVNVLGGPAFSRDLAAQIDKAYWGSNRSRAAALANKGKEAVANKYEDPIFAYIAQGPQSQDFSHQMTDMILGQLRPSKMDKGMVENFDKLMRETEIKKGMPGIPTWPGLKSKGLRDWLLTSKEGGAGRAKMAKLMDKSMYLKSPGFADVGVARYATTHPELLNTPIFSSGHMFSRMDPLGRLITNPKVPHPSYDTLLASPEGKQGYIGGFEYTLPPELHYYDYLSGQKSGYQTGIRPDLVEKPFTQKTMSLMRETPTVIGTPRWVDMSSEYQDIMRGLYGRRR
jgi:hypothetical protein